MTNPDPRLVTFFLSCTSKWCTRYAE